MIDAVIVLTYLLVVLSVGLYFGKGINTVRDFSIAPKTYAIPVVVATIFATIVDGASTLGVASEIFTMGAVFLVALFGETIREFLHGFFIVERIRNFNDALSTGDIMTKFYGKPGRIFTGIFAALVCVGTVGAQSMALGLLMQRFFGIPFFAGLFIGSVTIIIYSVRGGIKAVTTTDVIQFAVLIIAIPLLCNAALVKVGGFNGLISALPASYITLFPNKADFINCFGLFFIFAIPGLHPAVVQRMMMGKKLSDTKKSFIFSGLIYIPFYGMISLVGLIALALYPSIDANLALPHLIDNILPVGVRGLLIAGLVAVIMSTTDSFLNVGAITIVRDIIKPIKKNTLDDKQELYLMKITTLLVGIFGIITALWFQSIIELVVLAWGLWVATISVPILLGIFGHTAPKKIYLTALSAGVLLFVSWEIFLGADYGMGSGVPATLANLSVFLLYFTYKKIKHLTYNAPQKLDQ